MVSRPTDLIGREAELATLLDKLRRASAGDGTTVLLSGDPGMGKGLLVRAAKSRAVAPEEPTALRAARFVTGTCQREHDQRNAYEPFADLLAGLIASEAKTGAAKAILEAIKETAPDWLGMIPVLGGGLQAGAKTAFRIQELLAERDARALIAPTLASQFLDTINHKLSADSLLVLIIQHAQWIDGPSAGLLERLAQFITGRPAALIVTYRHGYIVEGHPLRAVRDELLLSKSATTIELDGLDQEAVASFVRTLTGQDLAPDVRAWLQSYTDGNPMFIEHLVGWLERICLLQRDGRMYVFDAQAQYADGSLQLEGRLADVTLPPNIGSALDDRINRLRAEDRDVLSIGAVEGESFLTAVLSELAHVEEPKLLHQLGVVERESHIIHYATSSDLQRKLFAYQFEHQLLQQRFYESLSQPERILYHGVIARALEEMYKDRPTRSVFLDIARHYERAGEALSAARALLHAAASAVTDGASAHARALEEHGLVLVRQALKTAERPEDIREGSALTGELVYLLLATVDPRGGMSAGGRELDVDSLLVEGKAAAARAGDPGLAARLLHVEGNWQIALGDTRKARDLLDQALRQTSAEDNVTRFAILIDLGNALNIGSLEAGTSVLKQAVQLYQSKLALSKNDALDSDLERLYHRLEAMIGIAECDGGNLGSALDYLERSVQGLTNLGRLLELPRVLNYLAQAALAAGNFESAEAHLQRAINILPEAVPNAWKAYNKALLGKVYLDAGRPHDAERWIRDGWAEMQLAYDVGMALIARQYLLEWCLREGASTAQLEEADGLVRAQMEEAERADLNYELVAAYSLRAELNLRRGKIDQALQDSKRAVSALERGDLPVVRTEEIFLRHARCLQAAQLVDDAATWRSRAEAVVARKARSLPHQEARRLIERTPTARALAVLPGSIEPSGSM